MSKMLGSVVLTGAARGLGAATAHALAERGYTVVGVDLNGEGLAKTIASLPGTGHRSVVGDVTAESTLIEACDSAAEAGGRLVGYVSNAGIMQVADSLETTAEDINRMLGVHVTAGLLGARTAAARITEGGSIVMISSVSGQLGFGQRAAYCAAKAGVLGTVKALAVEWAGRGIRVNAVAPGLIESEMSLDMASRGDGAVGRAFMRRIPFKRFGRAEEIGKAVTFLVSPDASYITGVLLPVDGGLLAWGMPNPGEVD